jgi:transposase
VREIDDDEGQRLVRIVRRGSGSVVTWRRAQMVLLSAQGMDVPAIAKVAFTSSDRVRDVIRNFNADGFSSLYPKYKGGHPPKFTLAQRREIKKIAKSKPVEHDLPFAAWSLAKLADFLVAEGVVDDISHEGLRVLLRQEGVTFQRLKTWEELEGSGLCGEESTGRAAVLTVESQIILLVLILLINGPIVTLGQSFAMLKNDREPIIPL